MEFYLLILNFAGSSNLPFVPVSALGARKYTAQVSYNRIGEVSAPEFIRFISEG